MKKEFNLLSENIQNYFLTHFGEGWVNEYNNFIAQDQKTFLRMNPLKIDSEKLRSQLKDNYDITISPIQNIENAFAVEDKANQSGKTLEHLLGYYYIQSLSSMIPPQILSPQSGEKVLDLCAAPGSKTTQISAMMKNNGTLIANEIQLSRVKMLVHNIERMNVINCGVSHQKGEWLTENFLNYFDKVLVDAPCSGLGIIQKKGEVNSWWNIQNAERLADMQYRLLVAAIKMTKENGTIIYSTCTMTLEENELVLNKILQKHPVELVDINLPVESIEGFTYYNNEKLNESLSKARRIIPWKINSEGFFIAALRKVESTESKVVKKIVDPYPFINFSKSKKFLQKIILDFGIEEDELQKFNFRFAKDTVYFINSNFDFTSTSQLHRTGIKFGTYEKSGQIILAAQAAQVLNGSFKKNIVELSTHSDLKIYFEGGIIKRNFGFFGQAAIKYREDIIGTAIITRDGLKSRFPRAYRTQEIVFAKY